MKTTTNKSSFATLAILLLYCVGYAQGEFIVELNKTDGTFIKVGSKITDVEWVYPNVSTYNENSGIYIFPSAQIEHRLFSINTSNGSIINNPLIDDLSAFAYNNSTNTIYGLEQVNSNNVKNLITINPITGSFTRLGNSLPSSSLFQGFVTLDETNGIYIFLAPPDILYSLNITNGNIISNPNLDLQSGESIINFKYNKTTEMLFGLLQDTNQQKYFLITINTSTGAVTKIGSGTTIGKGNGTSTIDELNQHYIHLFSNGLGGHDLITFDIPTGNLLSHTTIQQGDNLDNFHNIHYDNSKEILYSMHWDNDIVSSSSDIAKIQNKLLKIYPNPTSNNLIIQGSNLKFDEIEIYNNIGQNMTENISPIRVNENEIILNLVNLTSNIYFIKTKNNVSIIYKS